MKFKDLNPKTRTKGTPPCWTVAEAAIKFGTTTRSLTTLMTYNQGHPAPVNLHQRPARYNSILLSKWWNSLPAEKRNSKAQA